MTKKELASFIDATLVQNVNTLEEVDKLTSLTKKYEFASIFTLPSYTAFAAQKLALLGTSTLVGGVAGFPWGGETRETKVFEATNGIRHGAQEMDMVINLGYFFSGKYDEVCDEIKAIKDAIGDVTLKCIIEAPLLNEYQIRKATELVIQGGGNYVKTGTGFNGAATIEMVKIMKSVTVDDILIKAAGGIRTWKDAAALLAAGADRLGIGGFKAAAILDGGEE